MLLNNRGEAIGTQDKAVVHTEATPLHLAFSLYLFDVAGRVLLTRRALTKMTWPGVWTNTCCGHPAPGERPEEAVRRRLPQELGVEVSDLTCVLPDFSYTATDASGIVENEVCPVFAGRAASGRAAAAEQRRGHGLGLDPVGAAGGRRLGDPLRVQSLGSGPGSRDSGAPPFLIRPALTGRRLPRDADGARPPTTDGDDRGPPHLTTDRPPTSRGRTAGDGGAHVVRAASVHLGRRRHGSSGSPVPSRLPRSLTTSSSSISS